MSASHLKRAQHIESEATMMATGTATSSISSKLQSARSSRPQSSASSSFTSRSQRSSQSQRSSRQHHHSVPVAAPFNAEVEELELKALEASVIIDTTGHRKDCIVRPPAALEPAVSHVVTNVAILTASNPADGSATSGSTPNSGPALVSTPRFRFETFHHKVDYRWDGDRGMNTDVMIAKRRRLKQDASIQTWINVFWRTFHHNQTDEIEVGSSDSECDSNNGDDRKPDNAASSPVDGKDITPVTLEDPFAADPIAISQPAHELTPIHSVERRRLPLAGSVDRRAYLRVHTLWFKALHKLYDREDAHMQAIRDWTRDSWMSMTKDALDHHAFSDALFELVDIWTLTIEPQEYVHFLATLYHRVTRVKTWLADDGTILTKYIWRKTKFVKPSAVYRPYQYNKYKTIQWKEAIDVIHHLYSDSDNDSDPEEDDGSEDAVIRDFSMLADDDITIVDSDEESDDFQSENASDADETNSSPQMSRSKRDVRLSSSIFESLTGASIPENTGVGKSIVYNPSLPLLPLQIDPSALLAYLPEVNLEPPMSPFLDPPAFIPPTPLQQVTPRASPSEIDCGDFDIDDGDDEDTTVSVLSNAEEKLRVKLNVAIDALDQRKEDRFLKMINSLKTLLESNRRTLTRSASMLIVCRSGATSVDVEHALCNTSRGALRQNKQRSDSIKVSRLLPQLDEMSLIRLQVQKDKQWIHRSKWDRRLSAPEDLISLSKAHNERLEDSDSSSISQENNSDQEDEDVDEKAAEGSGMNTNSLQVPFEDLRPQSAEMLSADFDAFMASLQTANKEVVVTVAVPEMPPVALNVGTTNTPLSQAPTSNENDWESAWREETHSSSFQRTDKPLMSTEELQKDGVLDLEVQQKRPASTAGLSVSVNKPHEKYALNHTPETKSPAHQSKKVTKTFKTTLGDISLPHSPQVNLGSSGETTEPIHAAVEAACFTSVDVSEADDLHNGHESRLMKTNVSEVLSNIINGQRTKKLVQKMVDTRDVKKSDIDNKRIRDEALAHEYDEYALKANEALRTSTLRLRREMKDEAECSHVVEAPKETASQRPLVTRDGSVENQRQKEEEKKKRRDEGPAEDDSAPEHTMRAEQELCSLLHEAGQQRKIETNLKLQKQEITKKEKEARRKLKEEVTSRRTEQTTLLNSTDTSETKEVHEHSTFIPDKKKVTKATVEFAEETHSIDPPSDTRQLPTSQEELLAPSFHSIKKQNEIIEKEAFPKDTGLHRRKEGASAVTRRKAERDEDERKQKEIIQQKLHAETARAEELRTKMEKKVLKSKSVLKTMETEVAGKLGEQLTTSGASSLKTRPNFLKARKLESNNRTFADDSGNNSTKLKQLATMTKGVDSTVDKGLNKTFFVDETRAEQPSQAVNDLDKLQLCSFQISHDNPHLASATIEADAVSHHVGGSLETSSRATVFYQSQLQAAEDGAPHLSRPSLSDASNSIEGRQLSPSSSHVTASVSFQPDEQSAKRDSVIIESEEEDFDEEADRALETSEAAKYSFGGDWSLEKKRAFREAEFAAEKQTEMMFLAKSGELGLMELKWASQRERIKAEEKKSEQEIKRKQEVLILKEKREVEKMQKKQQAAAQAAQRSMEKRENAKKAEIQRRVVQESRLLAKQQHIASKRIVSKQPQQQNMPPVAVVDSKRRASASISHNSVTEVSTSTNIQKISTSTPLKGFSTSASVENASSTFGAGMPVYVGIQELSVTEQVESTSITTKKDPNCHYLATFTPGTVEGDRSAVEADRIPIRHLSVNSWNESDEISRTKTNHIYSKHLRESDNLKPSLDLPIAKNMLRCVGQDKAERQPRSDAAKPEENNKHATKVQRESELQSRTEVYNENTCQANAERAEQFHHFAAVPTTICACPEEAANTHSHGIRKIEFADIEPLDSEIKYWAKFDVDDLQRLQTHTREPLLSHRLIDENIVDQDSDSKVRDELDALRRGTRRNWGMQLAKEREPLVQAQTNPPTALPICEEAMDWQAHPVVPASPLGIKIGQLLATNTSLLTTHRLLAPDEQLQRTATGDEPLVLEPVVEYHAYPSFHERNQLPSTHAPSSPEISYEDDLLQERTSQDTHYDAPCLQLTTIACPQGNAHFSMEESLFRKEERNAKMSSILAEVLERSDQTVLAARAKRCNLMYELLSTIKARNELKRSRKTQVEEVINEAQEQARRRLDFEIGEWQHRKMEIVAVSKCLRAERSERKRQKWLASNDRYRQLTEQQDIVRQKIMAQIDERERCRLQRAHRRIAMAKAHLNATKVREEENRVRKLLESVEKAQALDKMQESREAEDELYAHIAQRLQTEREDEMERIYHAAEENQQKLLAQQAAEAQLAAEQDAKANKEKAKSAILAALILMKEEDNERKRKIEENEALQHEIVQEAEVRWNATIRKQYDSALRELIHWHETKEAELHQVEIAQRRAVLEDEERKREEVTVLRIAKKRATSNPSWENPEGETAVPHIVAVNQQPATSIASVSFSLPQSKMLVPLADDPAITAIRIKKTFERSRLLQGIKHHQLNREEEKSQMTLVNGDVSSEDERVDSARSNMADYHLVDQHEEPLISGMRSRTVALSVVKNKAPFHNQKAGFTVHAKQTLLVSGQRTYFKPNTSQSLCADSAVKQTAMNQCYNHISPTLPPSRAKLLQQKRMTCTGLSRTASLPHLSSSIIKPSNSLLWGNPEESFEVNGNKQRAFFRPTQFRDQQKHDYRINFPDLCKQQQEQTKETCSSDSSESIANFLPVISSREESTVLIPDDHHVDSGLILIDSTLQSAPEERQHVDVNHLLSCPTEEI